MMQAWLAAEVQERNQSTSAVEMERTWRLCLTYQRCDCAFRPFAIFLRLADPNGGMVSGERTHSGPISSTHILQ